ncbi:MAG: protein kinase [Desulfobacteraceae bacterium]|nr:protein kinase [Desulfobacteraceae bacterium]
MKSEERPFGKRYDVLETIGQGGMGCVYKVYDTVRDENLALKELSLHHTDSAAAILGFKNEFRFMSEFRHPNIVRVFEFRMSRKNIPIITMEFVPGKNLSELSDLSVEQVVDILVQICQVLAHIHSRLYVHRDLKPDNIKLLDDSSVKLLDYGLMSQLGVHASGKISGTYYYLAPEVITGGIIDESTDLYSLGIIGYELLTGKRPFTGNKSEILQGHLKGVPPEPASIRPDIPSHVNSVIMKLLEKDKDRRYRNSPEILEDLQFAAGKKRIIETTEQKHGYLYSSRLIGRAEETERFNKGLLQLQEGQSISLFVGAPAGMGKTRLLNEMKTLAELEGIHSLYVDSQLAGKGWINSLLRQTLTLSEEQDSQEEAISEAESEDKISGYLINLISSLTRKKPLVLFLDDLHWMDLKSIQVLNKLIRDKDMFRMLIVSTFRNDETDKTSPLWHTVEEDQSEYLELCPLSSKQIHELIENLLYPSSVSDDFSAYCFNNCGGNVFDLIEFLRYLVTESCLTKSGNQWSEPVNTATLSLPANLEERLLLRTGKLTPEIRSLAGAASVIGDDLDLESWQAVSEYEEDMFFQSIDELMSNQIVIRVNNHYQFSHDKIRTVIYESLKHTKKADFHLKTAKFLENKSAEDNQELIPRIARHFASAEDDTKAVEYSLKAARAAEQNNAEWDAFDFYRISARFLEQSPEYPNRDALLLEIYEKAALFSSAAWIDASTCLGWLQKAIDHYTEKQDMEKVFGLSLSYVVTSSITGNYDAARKKIPEITETCHVQEGTIQWAVLFGAGVCLTDWYQGYQNDCFDHAVSAVSIFESYVGTLPDDVWPAYSWSLFWRDKARAYLGKPVQMDNVEKIRQLMIEGKSDKTIYWHTLTAVTARAAFTGRWADLLIWKQSASDLSREMGKIYWFECWISHSYLYGAIHHGEFSQLENHIERVQASPDPYQMRLAWLFRGMLELSWEDFHEAEQNLRKFLELEEKSPDNSYLEGFIYLAQTYLASGTTDKARDCIKKGFELAIKGHYENPLYQLQFLQLKAELAITEEYYAEAENYLAQSLELAETLDNPIQTGFVRKMQACLLIGQNKPEQAEEKLNQAKDIFLSLDNKYQAGKVVTIIESLTHREEHRKEVQKPGADSSELTHTITEDADTITQTENTVTSEKYSDQEYTDDKTVVD